MRREPMVELYRCDPDYARSHKIDVQEPNSAQNPIIRPMTRRPPIRKPSLWAGAANRGEKMDSEITSMAPAKSCANTDKARTQLKEARSGWESIRLPSLRKHDLPFPTDGFPKPQGLSSEGDGPDVRLLGPHHRKLTRSAFGQARRRSSPLKGKNHGRTKRCQNR